MGIAHVSLKTRCTFLAVLLLSKKEEIFKLSLNVNSTLPEITTNFFRGTRLNQMHLRLETLTRVFM